MEQPADGSARGRVGALEGVLKSIYRRSGGGLVPVDGRCSAGQGENKVGKNVKEVADVEEKLAVGGLPLVLVLYQFAEEKACNVIGCRSVQNNLVAASGMICLLVFALPRSLWAGCLLLRALSPARL